jgi:hypothetical protein
MKLLMTNNRTSVQSGLPAIGQMSVCDHQLDCGYNSYIYICVCVCVIQTGGVEFAQVETKQSHLRQ